MFVPIVKVTVKPIQNANKPAIEKTHRTESCPVYLVKCYKRQWGITAEVTSEPIKGEDKLWKVPHMAGFSLVVSEYRRCQQKFPRGLFESVYDPEEFQAEFDKVAVEENPYLIAKAERDEANLDATVKRAAKGIMLAAGDAEAQMQRKKIGRPVGSKNKTDPVTVPE